MTEPRDEILECPDCGMAMWQPPGVTPECVSPWCEEKKRDAEILNENAIRHPQDTDR
jgi:hypothetical protein